MNYDRRQHPRYIPDSALLVSLGQSKRGFLKDVSESGMAFDGLLPSSGNNVIYLAFDLPAGGGAIEAVAEVVWTCEALHRTGVRFLELAEASRRQLRDWISSHVFALGDKASEEGTNIADYPAVDGPPVVPALASSLLPELLPELSPNLFPDLCPDSVPHLKLSEPTPNAAAHRREPKKARPQVLSARKMFRVPHAPASVGVVLVVLFLSTACVALGYYLPGIILGRGPTALTGPRTASVASNAPVSGSLATSPLAASVGSNPSAASIVAVNNAGVNHDAVNQSAATKPPMNEISHEVHEAVNEAASVAAPPAHGGFVLQIAAMAQAVNAAKLIEKLRQKNFPAFVPDRGKEPLYRVEVGPYEDITFARTVAGDLKSAGFTVILRRRSVQPDSNWASAKSFSQQAQPSQQAAH